MKCFFSWVSTQKLYRINIQDTFVKVSGMMSCMYFFYFNMCYVSLSFKESHNYNILNGAFE